jgi:hypothetical protein
MKLHEHHQSEPKTLSPASLDLGGNFAQFRGERHHGASTLFG